MKKLGLLMTPVVAIFVLVNCGGNSKPKKTYKVTIGETDHLAFTTLNGGSLDNTTIYENEDFKFKMKVLDDPSNYTYVVPSIINISINSMMPLVSGYSINKISNKEAEVTVNADKIIGDIVVSGEAGVEGGYRYRVNSYGLMEIPAGVVDSDDMLKIQFTPKEKSSNNETYSLPNAENIYIYFDKEDKWLSPADPSTIDEYCVYNYDKGFLVVKPYHIATNCIIAVRASDFPLLDSMSWDDINSISHSGIAPYLFCLGEEKIISVNNQPHRIRIIAFNHDNLVDENANRAGITFEFANLISDQNGYSLATPWNWDGVSGNASTPTNGDFINSSIRKALDGEGNGTIHWYQKGNDVETKEEIYKNKSILDMLPSDLRAVLKKVTKITTRYDSAQSKYVLDLESYTTKLFCLSYIEMTGVRLYNALPEGRVYEYYKNTVKEDLKWYKTQVKGSEGALQTAVPISDKKWTDVNIQNFAGIGWVSGTANLGSGWYWLRTPSSYPEETSPKSDTWCCMPSGEPITSIGSTYNYIMPVAPAFCI